MPRLQSELQQLRTNAAARDRSLARTQADLERERARTRPDDVVRVVRLTSEGRLLRKAAVEATVD